MKLVMAAMPPPMSLLSLSCSDRNMLIFRVIGVVVKIINAAILARALLTTPSRPRVFSRSVDETAKNC